MKISMRRVVRASVVILFWAASPCFLAAQGLQPIRNYDDSSNSAFPLPPNLHQEKPETANDLKGLKADSVAARIADRRHRYSWRPQWNMKGVPGVNLTGFSASTDGSVLTLAELSSNSHGNQSTLIVFYETSSWKIIRTMWLPGQRVVRFEMIPRTTLAIAVVQRQEALEQKQDSLLLINCEKGKVLDALQLPDTHGQSYAMACSDEFVIFKYFQSPGLTRYRVAAELSAAGTVNTKQIPAASGIIAFDHDGKTLVWAGDRSGWLLDPSSGLVKEKLLLPPGFEPVTAAFTDNGLALAAPGREIWLCRPDGNRELKVNGTGLMTWSPADHILYVEQMVRRSLVPIKFPELKFEKELAPIKSRPVLAGLAINFLPLGSGRLAMLTSLGDLVLLEKNQRNWQKTVIVSPLR